MSNSIVNYDGSITTTPRQLIYPQTVEEIQAVLRDSSTYPGPVRAKGSYHSLTPCASSDGTIVDMTRMVQVIEIDDVNHLFTAQAGLQIIDASKALREHYLQFMTNIEIGNVTLGAALAAIARTRSTVSNSGRSARTSPESGGSRPRAIWRKLRKPIAPRCCAWLDQATVCAASFTRSPSA